MIKPIQGSERRKFPVEIEAMHRLRAALSHERMAWPPDEHLAGQINPITGELLAGIVEVGIRAGPCCAEPVAPATASDRRDASARAWPLPVCSR
jgi:N-acyl-L-homoserine lactone synthetase